MAIAITIPRLGWNMDEGTFVGWLKEDGDTIASGDPLFALEGEKATQDIEAIDAGTLRIAPNAPKAGEVVAVGTVIGHLVGPGESAPAIETVAKTAAAVDSPAGNGEPSPAIPQHQPRRGDRPRISPLARRLAREMGVDWTRLVGSGCTGRIRKVDVLAAAATRKETTPTIAGRSLPISATRRTIAARMVQSRQTTVPVTLHATADATNLVSLRAQFKAAEAPGRETPGYLEFLVKLTALALLDHPMLHAQWNDDRLIVPDEPHIGIAVDTEDGLLVPVIREPARLGLGEIVTRSRDLAQRARNHTLRPVEMQGGTFTITNLGGFGIEGFTPIINPPESAVLGMGRIAREPVYLDDRVVPRDRMTLSLTFDHRVVDGAPAARFLQALADTIANPAPRLIR